jgi:hypothetical protein
MVDSSNNYVRMSKEVCVVCGNLYLGGDILIHKQLKEIKEEETITGLGLCPEHQKLKDDGFVAIVACDKDKSDVSDTGIITPAGVYRTGPVAHLKLHAFKALFDTDPPDHMVVFGDAELLTQLEKMRDAAKDRANLGATDT